MLIFPILVTNPWELVLDEIKNNLDLETNEYVVQVLNHYYLGAMIVVSHEENF